MFETYSGSCQLVPTESIMILKVVTRLIGTASRLFVFIRNLLMMSAPQYLVMKLNSCMNTLKDITLVFLNKISYIYRNK